MSPYVASELSIVSLFALIPLSKVCIAPCLWTSGRSVLCGGVARLFHIRHVVPTFREEQSQSGLFFLGAANFSFKL